MTLIGQSGSPSAPHAGPSSPPARSCSRATRVAAEDARMNSKVPPRGGVTPSPKRKQLSTPTAKSPPKPTRSPRKPATPRKRKNLDGGEEEPEERRPKRYRTHPPADFMVKHERVMTQRMFLIERSGRKDGAFQEDFSVLGSTGNVYIVNVSEIPTYPSLPIVCLKTCVCVCMC